MITCPCPDYSPDTTLLVFPGSHSRTLEQILGEGAGGGGAGGGAEGGAGAGGGAEEFPYKTVVFVDSTWNQCYGICQDPRYFQLNTSIRFQLFVF